MECVVVLRAPSRVRFMPNEEVLISASSVFGPLAITMWTRWEDTGLEHPVPRELCVEARGAAPSADAALGHFPSVARAFGPILSFVGDVEVGMVDVHLVLDVTPGTREREFIEVFQPDERGIPREGRVLNPVDVAAVVDALGSNPQLRWLLRVIGLYDLALQHWFIGGEALASEYLFMAAESLARLIRRLRIESLGDIREVAASLGIDSSKRGWKSDLVATIRRDLVFAGDADTHDRAREASDGLEHGFMEIEDVAERSREVASLTFGHIRAAIVELIGVGSEVAKALVDRQPLDVRSTRRLVRGRFVEGTGELAAPGERYPILRWSADVSKLSLVTPRKLDLELTDTLTVVAGDEVQFRMMASEVYGRPRPDQSTPIKASGSWRVSRPDGSSDEGRIVGGRAEGT